MERGVTTARTRQPGAVQVGSEHGLGEQPRVLVAGHAWWAEGQWLDGAPVGESGLQTIRLDATGEVIRTPGDRVREWGPGMAGIPHGRGEHPEQDASLAGVTSSGKWVGTGCRAAGALLDPELGTHVVVMIIDRKENGTLGLWSTERVKGPSVVAIEEVDVALAGNIPERNYGREAATRWAGAHFGINMPVRAWDAYPPNLEHEPFSGEEVVVLVIPRRWRSSPAPRGS